MTHTELYRRICRLDRLYLAADDFFRRSAKAKHKEHKEHWRRKAQRKWREYCRLRDTPFTFEDSPPCPS